MKFRTLSGTRRIATLKGHVFIVGEDFVDVPEEAIDEVKAAGCISEEDYKALKKKLMEDEGGSGSDPDEDPEEKERAAMKVQQKKQHDEIILKIKDAMLDAIAEHGEEVLTKHGIPNKKYIKHRVNISDIPEDLYLQAWALAAHDIAETEGEE